MKNAESNGAGENKTAADQIAQLRHQVDFVDRLIASAFVARFVLTDAIGEIRARDDLPVTDIAREQEVMEQLAGSDDGGQLSEDFIKGVWSVVIEESKKRQAAMQQPAEKPEDKS